MSSTRAQMVPPLAFGLVLLGAAMFWLRDQPTMPAEATDTTSAQAPEPSGKPSPAPSEQREPTPPASAPTSGKASPEGDPPTDTAAPSVLPELALRLGAEHFAKGDMAAARDQFRAIVDDSPDHPMAPYAAYKLAWCEANLGDHRAAVAEMQRVVRWLRDDGRPEEAVTLREALADLEHFRSQLDTGA